MLDRGLNYLPNMDENSIRMDTKISVLRVLFDKGAIGAPSALDESFEILDVRIQRHGNDLLSLANRTSIDDRDHFCTGLAPRPPALFSVAHTCTSTVSSMLCSTSAMVRMAFVITRRAPGKRGARGARAASAPTFGPTCSGRYRRPAPLSTQIKRARPRPEEPSLCRCTSALLSKIIRAATARVARGGVHQKKRAIIRKSDVYHADPHE